MKIPHLHHEKLKLFFNFLFLAIIVFFVFYINNATTYLALHTDAQKIFDYMSKPTSYWQIITSPYVPSEAGYYRPVSMALIKYILSTVSSNVIYIDYILKSLFSLFILILFFIFQNISKKPFLSLILSLTAAMNPYSAYHIATLWGSMETICSTFSIIILFTLYKFLHETDKKKYFIYFCISSFFYFLIINSHERFLLLLGCFFIAAFFKENVHFKNKILLFLIPFFLFTTNIILRFYLIGDNFINGGGGKLLKNHFSIVTSIEHFFYSLSTILNISMLEIYLGGINFAGISIFYKIVSLLAFATAFVFLIYYIYTLFKKTNENIYKFNYILLILTFILIIIASSSITFRIESRWLFPACIGIYFFICHSFSTLYSRESTYFFSKKSIASLFIIFMIASNISNFNYRSYILNVYHSENLFSANYLYKTLVEGIGLENLSSYDDIYISGIYCDKNFLQIYYADSNIEYPPTYCVDSFSKIASYTKGNILKINLDTYLNEYVIHKINRFILEPGTDRKSAFFVHGVFSDSWVTDNAKIKIRTKDDGKITIMGYYPGKIEKPLKLEITLNYFQKNTFEVNSNSFEIELIARPNSEATLDIFSYFTFKPEGIDNRKLSFYLRDIFTQ